jgi:hypothetical protein
MSSKIPDLQLTISIAAHSFKKSVRASITSAALNQKLWKRKKGLQQTHCSWSWEAEKSLYPERRVPEGEWNVTTLTAARWPRSTASGSGAGPSVLAICSSSLTTKKNRSSLPLPHSSQHFPGWRRSLRKQHPLLAVQEEIHRFASMGPRNKEPVDEEGLSFRV